MIFVVLRVVIVAGVLWLLWRLCTTVFSARKSQSTHTQQDEWQEVLEAIDELPETTEPQPRAQERRQPLPPPLEDPASQTSIETVMIHEAEAALSRIRKGDEHQRLAAYHELRTYKKLCRMADSHLSEATRSTIDDVHRQAREIICPPEKN